MPELWTAHGPFDADRPGPVARGSRRSVRRGSIQVFDRLHGPSLRSRCEAGPREYEEQAGPTRQPDRRARKAGVGTQVWQAARDPTGSGPFAAIRRSAVNPVRRPDTAHVPGRLEQDVDYPDWQDAREQGVDDYDGGGWHRGARGRLGLHVSQERHQLGGWPYWIQSNDWATCPVCRMRMTQLVIQLPHSFLPADRTLFGDCGNAYLMECMPHREQLALVWQC